MRFITTVVILGVTLLLFVSGALAGHKTWENRDSVSERGRLCKGDMGDGSWVSRDGYTRCGTCNSRCYITTFTATAETSGGPAGLCDTQGDECEITIYFETAPCCACPLGHAENCVLEETDDEKLEIRGTESRCEVPKMRVLVDGCWALPLENGCNTSTSALFQQEWVSDDCTVNSLSDCVDQGNAGARLTQAYNKDYRNGRYPDPCFADSHLVESFTSEEKGLIGSRFQMWRPNSNAVWFDTVITRDMAPKQTRCSHLPQECDACPP